MKQVILIMLLAFGMNAFAGNDDQIVISGYFMNNDRVTVQVYQGNDLVLEKKPILDYYKLKLPPGEYTIYFTDNNTTKKLFLDSDGSYSVEIDVDFSMKYDCYIRVQDKKVNYSILNKF